MLQLLNVIKQGNVKKTDGSRFMGAASSNASPERRRNQYPNQPSSVGGGGGGEPTHKS